MGYFLLGSSGFAHSLFAAGERDARTSNSSMKMRKAVRRFERMLPIAGSPPVGSKPALFVSQKLAGLFIDQMP